MAHESLIGQVHVPGLYRLIVSEVHGEPRPAPLTASLLEGRIPSRFSCPIFGGETGPAKTELGQGLGSV